MRHVDLALRSFSESLAEVISDSDRERLRGFLLGRSTPALGGDLPPGEIIRQALFLHSEARSLAKGLAALLAEVVRHEIRDLRNLRAALKPAGERLLLEVLGLAAELPAHTDLFSALQELLAVLRHLPGKKGGSAAVFYMPLWQALAYQQTDASLEPEWLALLRDSPDAAWTPGRRTLLLIAWQGLLWIPPDHEAEIAAEVINFDRIETSLLALAASVHGQAEAEDLLREALELLRDAFPRSSDFWEEHLLPRMGQWPGELRERVFEVWPGLQSFFWSSPSTHEHGPLSLYWSLVKPDQNDESPLEALFSPETKSFWEEVGIRNLETFSRKIERHLASSQALKDLFGRSREPTLKEPEIPAAIQLFAGSLLLHRLAPEPDLVRIVGSTLLWSPCESESPWQNEWRVLECPPSLTRFAFEEASLRQSIPQEWTDAFRQELAHQAVAALAQFEPFERQMADISSSFFRQMEGQALEHRRALVPDVSAFQDAMAEIRQATEAQLVQQRSRIALIPGLQPTTALSLSFLGPPPESYLRELAALLPELKEAALDQLRRALQSAWNPLERLYLQAVTTLMALQEEDFLRALQELNAAKSAVSILTVEHQVLKLHAKAGVGDRRVSVQLFKALEQKELAEPVQRTLDLLDDAYGLSGRETVPDSEQYKEIIRREAAMIEAATSLKPAA